MSSYGCSMVLNEGKCVVLWMIWVRVSWMIDFELGFEYASWFDSWTWGIRVGYFFIVYLLDGLSMIIENVGWENGCMLEEGLAENFVGLKVEICWVLCYVIVILRHYIHVGWIVCW